MSFEACAENFRDLRHPLGAGYRPWLSRNLTPLTPNCEGSVIGKWALNEESVTGTFQAILATSSRFIILLPLSSEAVSSAIGLSYKTAPSATCLPLSKHLLLPTRTV